MASWFDSLWVQVAAGLLVLAIAGAVAWAYRKRIWLKNWFTQSLAGVIAGTIAGLVTTVILGSIFVGSKNIVTPNMVVAFASECPEGWAQYYHAAGRVVVGAGSHDPNPTIRSRDSNGVELITYGLGQIGGTNFINHNHHVPYEMRRVVAGDELPDDQLTRVTRFLSPDPQESVFRADGDTSVGIHTGDEEASADENEYYMPPYIALYWCTPL